MYSWGKVVASRKTQLKAFLCRVESLFMNSCAMLLANASSFATHTVSMPKPLDIG